MTRWVATGRLWPCIVSLIGGLATSAFAAPQGTASAGREAIGEFIGSYCVECHNREEKAAGLALDGFEVDAIGRDPKVWEKVYRRLATRQMPPEGAIRPSGRRTDAIAATLGATLDRAASERPDPGRGETFRRLTRTEYQNAIRDLLALEVDASTLLPPDESSRGFDNLTVGDLSPTLLDRSIAAAQKIARLAIGAPGRSPGGDTIRVPADLTQEEHVEGLPIGTRGGAVVPYIFPQDGEYEIQLRLARDRNEHLEGLREPHELEVLVDRERKALFTVEVPKTERDHQTGDEHLKARISVAAGPREVGVTFLKESSSLLETKRQPFQAHYNMHRHPRLTPALYQVSITGPYQSTGRGDTPSRRRIFAGDPGGPDEDVRGRAILAALARRAYRRPVGDADLRKPLELFRRGSVRRGFRGGPGAGPGRDPGQPAVPLPRRGRPARSPARHALSAFGRPACLQAVVLPLEQHPRRRAARAGRTRRAGPARGGRTPGPADAGRPPLAEPGDQLRGPVAAPPQPGVDHPRPPAVPRLRRQPPAGPSAARPNCSSRGSSARTGASSTC